jgi:hypothetical protein
MPSIAAFKGEVQGGEFGWEDFLLTSREDKEQYLGSTLWSNMVRYALTAWTSTPANNARAGAKIPATEYGPLHIENVIASRFPFPEEQK